MKTMLIGLGLLLSLLTWNACDTKHVSNFQRKAIDKPLPEIATHADQLSVDPAIGGTFKLQSGTTIHIPKSAFTKLNGELVRDSVSISFEEYHDAAEILLSGITMVFTENGVEKPFESAGMFKIEGKSGNEKIALAEDKTIRIDLASKQSDEGYDLYVLNEETGKWSVLNEAPVSDQTPIANENKNVQVMPTLPDLPDPKRPVLDLDLNYSNYPQLSDLYGLAWQIEKNENLSEEEISNGGWKSISLESTGSGINDFRLKLAGDQMDQFVNIKPVISKEKRAALEIKYQAEMRRLEAEQQRQKNQAEATQSFTRSLQINGFGIYNCDRVIQMTASVTIDAKFNYNGEEITGNYYLISNDNSAVLQYGKVFRMDASRKNKLVFIRDNQSIYYADQNQLERIGQLALTSQNQNLASTINLKKHPVKMEREEDLKSFLTQL